MDQATFEPVESRFPVEPTGEVSSLLLRPPDAWCLYVLAHGAGAGMRHRFLNAISLELARLGVATFRFQFPYMEIGRRAPDRAPILERAVRAAVAAAAEAVPDLPLLAGGKSMGGRMASRAAAEESLPGVRGLVFLGFPLHPAGRPSSERAEHLSDVELPMLFVQGTRDRLADLKLLEPVIEQVSNRARLHLIAGGDHSFQVLKRSGRSEEDVLGEIAGTIADWAPATLGLDSEA